MSPESEVDDKLAKSMISQARKESQRMFGESDELKQLIKDAAELLGLEVDAFTNDGVAWVFPIGTSNYEEVPIAKFNPLDPERGDLMKVAEAAELCINYKLSELQVIDFNEWCIKHEESFTKGDYQSLALAILRAASAVRKARGDIPQK